MGDKIHSELRQPAAAAFLIPTLLSHLSVDALAGFHPLESFVSPDTGADREENKQREQKDSESTSEMYAPATVPSPFPACHEIQLGLFLWTVHPWRPVRGC